MEVFEKVGTRAFSARLELDGRVTLKEGTRELTKTALNSALPTSAENNDPAIRRFDDRAIIASVVARICSCNLKGHCTVASLGNQP